MKEKKFIIIFAILLVAAVAIYISVTKKEDTKDNLILISLKELEAKVENKETFPVLVTKDGCSYCELFKPTVEEVSKEYKVDIYQLNLSELSKEDETNLKDIFNVSSTPTILFIGKGVEKSTLNRIKGNTTKEKLVNKLILNEYIKE